MTMQMELPRSPLARWLSFVWLLLAGLAIVQLYGPALAVMVERWIREEQYNFAFMLPLLAAYRFHVTRHRLVPAGPPSVMLIGAILLAALVLEIVGLASSIFYLQHLSFLALLLALAVYRYGTRNLRVLFPVFLFLLFAIPLPYVLESALTWRLQGLSAAIGRNLIAAFGIPVFLDGNILELSQHRLQVAEACSGLNYLYPLIGLGVVLATFAPHKSLLSRIVIVLSAVPIAILMNGLRIGIAGILVEHYGQAAEQGLQHYFQGWVVFLISLALMALLVRLLPNRTPGTPSSSDESPATTTAPASYAGHRTLAGMTLVLLGILLAFQAFRTQSSIPPERESFDTFPPRIAGWRVIPSRLVPDLIGGLAADDTLAASLIDGRQDSVSLFIAYYDHQESGRSPHSPKVCMPGGGWEIMDTRRIRMNANGRSQPVNRVRIVKGNDTLLVYYWYYGRGKWLANEWRMKWELFRDAMLGQPTNNSLVRLSTLVPPGDPAAADRTLQRALRDLAPLLPRYLD